MWRQWGNAVLTSLKRSEKEGATCPECIRPQCNSRKVCLADRESLNQSTSFKNSCACRNGSAPVSLCAKSLAQCNTWKCGLDRTVGVGPEEQQLNPSVMLHGAGELSKAFSWSVRPSMLLFPQFVPSSIFTFLRSLTS